MDLKETFAKVREIYDRAQNEASPYLAALRPYAEAAAHAQALGLSADSSADEIIEAFAGSVNLQDAPSRPLVPTVLAAGAPEEIAAAAKEVEQTYTSIGTAVGKIAGLIAALR